MARSKSSDSNKQAFWIILALVIAVLLFGGFLSKEEITVEASRCKCPAGQSYYKGVCEEILTHCPMVVLHVCGCNGVTYNNGCEAKKAGVKSSTPGKCKEADNKACQGEACCGDNAVWGENGKCVGQCKGANGDKGDGSSGGKGGGGDGGFGM